jgi:hypothetical protein
LLSGLLGWWWGFLSGLKGFEMDQVRSYVRKHGMQAAVAVFGFGAVQSAMAAALDITSATGALSSVSETVPLVGAALLGVLGLMAAWKLARGLFA